MDIDIAVKRHGGLLKTVTNQERLMRQAPPRDQPKTDDELEAPYPFLPKGAKPDFDLGKRQLEDTYVPYSR